MQKTKESKLIYITYNINKYMANGYKLKRLEFENKSLKETLEILSNKKIIKEISQSLKEIKQGKTYPISTL